MREGQSFPIPPDPKSLVDFQLGDIADMIESYWSEYATKNPSEQTDKVLRDVRLLAGVIRAGDHATRALIEAYSRMQEELTALRAHLDDGEGAHQGDNPPWHRFGTEESAREGDE